MPTLRDDLAEGGYKYHVYMHRREPSGPFLYTIESLKSSGGRVLCTEAPAATFAKITAFSSKDGSRLDGLSGFTNLGSCLDDPRADETIVEKIKSNTK